MIKFLKLLFESLDLHFLLCTTLNLRLFYHFCEFLFEFLFLSSTFFLADLNFFLVWPRTKNDIKTKANRLDSLEV